LFFFVLSVALASAQLYGVTKDNQLASLASGLSGVWTTIGGPFSAPSEFVTLVQVADLDVANGTFYLIGINKTSHSQYLVGLNIYTGKITTRHILPFEFTFDFVSTPGLDWIPGSHDLLVYGATHAGLFNIYRVTPATGTFVLVTSFTYPGYVLESIDTYDSVNGYLWIQLSGYRQLRNLAFDIATGNLVWNLTDVYGIMSLNFNPIDGLVYAVASNDEYQTNVVTISNGVYNVVGALTNIGAATVTGPQNAGLDYNEGTIYIYLETVDVDSIFASIPIQKPANWQLIGASSIVPATIVFGNE